MRSLPRHVAIHLFAVGLVFANAHRGLTQEKPNPNNRDSQVKIDFLGDPFLNLLDEANAKVFNSLGTNAVSGLNAYIQKTIKEIQFLQDEAHSDTTEIDVVPINESLWLELISKSKYLQSLNESARQLIKKYGLGVFVSMTNHAVELEDKLFELYRERKKKVDSLINEGEFIAGDELLIKLLDSGNRYIEGDSRELVSQWYIDLASSLNKQGKFKESRENVVKGQEIVIDLYGDNHPKIGEATLALASLNQKLGFTEEVEKDLKKVLRIWSDAYGAYDQRVAVALNNLSHHYYTRGLYGKSLALLERVLEIHSIKNDLSLENSLYSNSFLLAKSNLGELYLKMGRYIEAEKIHKEVLDASTELGNLKLTAAAYDYLADNYQQQNRHEHALKYYALARKTYIKLLGQSHPLIAEVAAGQGLSALSIYNYESAATFFLEALKIHRQFFGDYHHETATSLHNIGYLESQRGNAVEALSRYKQSLAIKQRIYEANHPRFVVSYNNIALSNFLLESHANAANYLRKGLELENHLLQRETQFISRSQRMQFVNSLGDAYLGAFALAETHQALTQVAMYARLNRHGLLAEIEKRQAQLAALPGKQQEVVQELRAVTQQLSSLTIKPQQRQALRVRQEELEKQLYRLLPQLKPRVVEVEQVAKALPDEGVLIEFQRYLPFDSKKPIGQRWGSARYLAMVLKPNGSVTVVELGEAAMLEQAIAAAVSTTGQAQEDAGQKLEKISQLLLKPLKGATAGAKTWFISPDGELNRLPFAALKAPGGKGYLAETVNLRLLTTGRELLDLQQASPSAKSAALVVANPAYDRSVSRGGGSTAVFAANSSGASDGPKRSSDLPEQLKWDPLPATAQEGETVKTITGGSLLIQQKATAEAVKGTPAPKLLHLATHAFYLPNQPQQETQSLGGLMDQRASNGVVRTKSLQGESPLLRSGIALAGANQPNADPKDDGYLTALEVAQLSWEGTDLVVISACESGLGDLQVGEGVYGLKRAISVAGARSSLLSLWKVDDSATAAFMESFYKRLKEGKGKAEALAKTQKEFRSHPIPMWREPYVWAAFQLSGDWGPVKGL